MLNLKNRVSDCYDSNAAFATILAQAIPGFEYPNWSHKTIREVLLFLPLHAHSLTMVLEGNASLAEHVDVILSRQQHRFELHDPFAECTYRWYIASAAIEKAKELRAGQFQFVHPGEGLKGIYYQVKRVEGEWFALVNPSEPTPLHDVQMTLNCEGLRDIILRADLRLTVKGDRELDRKMASADAFAFLRIDDNTEQKSAAARLIIKNTHLYPDYQIGLKQALPGYPGITAKITELASIDESSAALEFKL